MQAVEEAADQAEDVHHRRHHHDALAGRRDAGANPARTAGPRLIRSAAVAADNLRRPGGAGGELDDGVVGLGRTGRGGRDALLDRRRTRSSGAIDGVLRKRPRLRQRHVEGHDRSRTARGGGRAGADLCADAAIPASRLVMKARDGGRLSATEPPRRSPASVRSRCRSATKRRRVRRLIDSSRCRHKSSSSPPSSISSTHAGPAFDSTVASKPLCPNPVSDPDGSWTAIQIAVAACLSRSAKHRIYHL